MQKNLRIMVGLLALLLALTACQPTPEAEPVIQKDTEKLIEMAVGVTDEQAGEKKVTLAERFGERFAVDYTTTTSGAKVTGDVKIRYLADYAFPMYRVKNVMPDGALVKELARRLLEGEDVYSKTYFTSKADIKERIDSMTKALSNEEWMKMHREEEEDYDQWLAEYMQEIQDLQKQYDAMTGEEERPKFERWDGKFREVTPEEFTAEVYLVAHEDDFGDVPEVNVAWYTDTFPYFNMYFNRTMDDSGFGYEMSEIAEDWSVPCKGAKMTPQEAIDKAMELFEGILDVVPTEVRWGDNGTGTGAYTIYFSRNYNGAGAIYTDVDTSEVEVADESGEGTTLYCGWSHERIRVSVNENGIRSFQWRCPMEVVDKLSDNVNLLDFDTVMNLFQQQMNRRLAMEEGKELELMAVTLGLMPIREQDSPNTALLVPVWYIRYWNRDIEPETQIRHGDHNPLCVLNAIDGSVIDTNLGY